MSYTHFTEENIYAIEIYIKEWYNKSQIAKKIWKCHTSIWRLIKKHTTPKTWLFNAKYCIEEKRKYEELSENIIDYDKEIKKLLKKQDNLLDMSLEWQISKEIYLRKNNEIEEEIRELKSRKNNIKNDDFLKKTWKWLELAGSLYISYFRWNKELKTEIIKKT